MPVCFVDLFLSFAEALFLFNKQVQQQAANRSVFDAFFQFTSKAFEIFPPDKGVGIIHALLPHARSPQSMLLASAGRKGGGQLNADKGSLCCYSSFGAVPI